MREVIVITAQEGQGKRDRVGRQVTITRLIATVYRGQGQGTQVGGACLAYEAEVKSLSHTVRQENATLMNNATGNKERSLCRDSRASPHCLACPCGILRFFRASTQNTLLCRVCS